MERGLRNSYRFGYRYQAIPQVCAFPSPFSGDVTRAQIWYDSRSQRRISAAKQWSLGSI
jgi:hypothetical protein